MTLLNLITYIPVEETIHIMTVSETVFYGKAGDVYRELDKDLLRTAKVAGIFNGFGGMCIDVYK